MRESSTPSPYDLPTGHFFGAVLPGLPHILQDKACYQDLKEAVLELGTKWASQGVERLFFLSTQWKSVLGHSFLVGPDCEGEHLDENWYDLGKIPFHLTFDPTLVQNCARAAEVRGFQVRLIDVPGFPLDTGTLVAHHLLESGARKVSKHISFKIGAVSCSIYSDYRDTLELGQCLSAVLRNQQKPCGVVVVSQLSGRTLPLDYGEELERIAGPKDQLFNEACILAIQNGNSEHLRVIVDEKGREVCADMSLRGLAFLEGLGLWGKDMYGNTLSGNLKAYGSLHGCGAAVIEFGTGECA